MKKNYGKVRKTGNMAQYLLLYTKSIRFCRKFASRFFHNQLNPKVIHKTRLSAFSVNFCKFTEFLQNSHPKSQPNTVNKTNFSTKHEGKTAQQNTFLPACIVHVVRVPQGRGINDAAVFAYSKSLITKLLRCYGDAEGEKRQSLKMDVAAQRLKTDFLWSFITTRLSVISHSCFDVFHEQHGIEILQPNSSKNQKKISPDGNFCIEA